MKKTWSYAIFILFIASVLTWSAVIKLGESEDNLAIIACDVGQGDAILIQKGSAQILIDGGQGESVMSCLSRHMPFWDRKIELVVLTHPQMDHYGGLIYVFKHFDIDSLLTNDQISEAESYLSFKNAVNSEKVDTISAETGKRLNLGEIGLEVLHPAAETKSSDPNDHSVVVSLKYKKFEALFTGDLGPKSTEEMLTNVDMVDIDYLKVPHHGSKNGLTSSLLEKTSPEIAVISAGKSNRFGHPHQEVLGILKEANIETLRTDQLGDVIVKTDGKNIWKVIQ